MILFAILTYVVLQLALAAWAARGTSDEEDYLVAGRSLGRGAVALSIFATWFAAETVIATSSEVASDGLAGARVEPFGYTIGIIALAVLVAVKLRRDGHLTLAGFLGARFGPRVEGVSAVIIVLASIVWAAAQLNALAVTLADASGLGFPVALIAGTGIVLAYTWLGGLKGDVLTDILQGGVMIVGLLIMGFIVIQAAGGLGEALSAVPRERWTMRPEGESTLQRAELWLLPVFGTVVAQEAISRILAAKSPRVAREGALLGAGIYLGIGLIPVFLGLTGPALGLTDAVGDSFFPALAGVLLPVWLYVVITGALLSAILSSVDSALLSASAVATETGLRRLRPDASAKARLFLARTATMGAGLVAAVIAASGQSLREIVLTGEGIGGLLVVPLMVGLFIKSRAETGVLASLFVSFVLTVWLDWIAGVPGAFLYALAGGAASFLIVEGLMRARPDRVRS